MSVNENHYIILGIKMDFDEYQKKFNVEENDSVHDQYTNRRNQKAGDIVVVVDGMSGEYAVIGRLIAKSRESYEGIPMTVIDKKVFNDKKLKKALIESFGFHEDEIIINIYAFTHYSWKIRWIVDTYER